MKIVSLETRASSAEQENDSLKLALKLIMREMSVGEGQQQRNQSYEVTASQGNSKSDNAQSNESSARFPYNSHTLIMHTFTV